MASVEQWQRGYRQLLDEQEREPRWILDVAAALSRVALDQWRCCVVHGNMHDHASVELVAAAGSRRAASRDDENKMTWEGLVKRCDKMCSYAPDQLEAVELAVALLHAAVCGEVVLSSRETVRFSEQLRVLARQLIAGKVTTRERPGTAERRRSRQSFEPPPVSERASGSFDARCLYTAVDHRALVVGELPRLGLHPIIVVRPQNQPDHWYLQEAPIVKGRAFGGLVYFGNPGLIGHPGDESNIYYLKVLALEQEWHPQSDRRAPLDEDALEAIAKRGVVWPSDQPAGHAVVRAVPPLKELHIDAERIAIIASPNDHAVTLPIPLYYSCTSPVTLSWTGIGPILVEVRRADGDVLVTEPIKCLSSDRVVLAAAGSAPVSGMVIALPRGNETYRVKIYPVKREIKIDPIIEVWLKIGAF